MADVAYLGFRWGKIGSRNDQILIECIADGIALECIADRLGCSLYEVEQRSSLLRKLNLLITAEEAMKIADRKNAERFGLKDALARIGRDAQKAREGTLRWPWEEDDE